MTEDEYQDWNLAFLAASLDLSSDKYRKMDEVAAMLEQDFQLIGSTAIEDRLQQGVPEAISHIRQAGLKIWVLTGDKLETAINIGYSSSLLDSTQNICIVDGTSKLVLLEQLNVLKSSHGNKHNAVILSGESLIILNEDQNLKSLFD